MNNSLLDQTRHYLSTNSSALKLHDVQALQSMLREHNRLYYNENAPIISDREYDQLFSLLKSLEERYHIDDPTSPTRRIDVIVSRQFEKITHDFPMISLDNTYNIEDIRDFENRMRNILNTDRPIAYIVETKFDGISLALRYRE
jgi:DNA ligase (NAD+)